MTDHDKARTEKSRELVEDWLSSKRKEIRHQSNLLNEYYNLPWYKRLFTRRPR